VNVKSVTIPDIYGMVAHVSIAVRTGKLTISGLDVHATFVGKNVMKPIFGKAAYVAFVAKNGMKSTNGIIVNARNVIKIVIQTIFGIIVHV
jgi:hypothetical protein